MIGIGRRGNFPRRSGQGKIEATQGDATCRFTTGLESKPVIFTIFTNADVSDKSPGDSLGRIGSLKRTSDKSLFPMALGRCLYRILYQHRPINMNGRSILSETSMLGGRDPQHLERRAASTGYMAMAEQVTGRPIPDVVTLQATSQKEGLKADRHRHGSANRAADRQNPECQLREAGRSRRDSTWTRESRRHHRDALSGQ